MAEEKKDKQTPTEEKTEQAAIAATASAFAKAGTEQVEADKPKDAEPKKAEDAESAKTGESQTADDVEKVQLSAKQLEAVKAAGIDPDLVVKLGAAGLAMANRLANERSSKDRMAGQVGILQQQIKELQAAIEAAKTRAPDPAGGEDDEELPGDVEVDKLIGSHNTTRKDVKALRRQVAELTEQLSSMKEQQEQASAVDVQAADEFFGGLEEDDFPAFGKGVMSDLEPDSPEAQARNEVYIEADRLRQLARKRGKSLTMKDALQAALASPGLYHDEVEAAANRKRLREAEKLRRGSVEAPTARRQIPAAKTPEEAAAAIVADAWRKAT